LVPDLACFPAKAVRARRYSDFRPALPAAAQAAAEVAEAAAAGEVEAAAAVQVAVALQIS